MEAERRSTVSSLRGQLSNVEGSVKSMKAAVVVGSVLTVACLAAVFGVTVLANEVSKEVKVSNGTLATKSGKSVLTTSSFSTSKAASNTKTVTIGFEGASVTSAVNAVVAQGETTTIICDELVIVQNSGVVTDVSFAGTLESIVGGSVAKRTMANKYTVWGFLIWLVEQAVAALYDCLTGAAGKEDCTEEAGAAELALERMGKYKR